VAQLLRDEMTDPGAAWQTALAWNKLLMVQLDVLIAGYVTEQPFPPTSEEPTE
jgi:hypothetical protein